MAKRSSKNLNGPVSVTISQEAEDAVRTYLELLDNPDARVTPKDSLDVAAIRASTDDPLEAVRLVNKALRDAELEDPEAAFIRYAKTWAKHNDITREAFEAYGVKSAVLNKAFGDREPQPSANRRERVNIETVIAGVQGKPPGTILTTSSVMEEFGGSRGTVRTLLERLAGDGTLINKGPDPDHHGKGRASTQFEKL